MGRRNLRVKLHSDNTTTLVGVDFSDLRALVVAASLYRYDHDDEEKLIQKAMEGAEKYPEGHYMHKLCEENAKRDVAWSRHQRLLIKRIEKAIEKNFYQSGKDVRFKPVILLKPHEKAERVSLVQQARDRRLTLSKIMEAISAKMRGL